jgi:Zn-dependent protease
MEAEQQTPPVLGTPTAPPSGNGSGGSGGNNRMKKAAGPLAAVVALLAKFKVALIALVKFLPLLLKTGGTMFLMIWIYAKIWGWWFALGFVVLLLIHECGHLIAARRIGLKVGAPVFIPFVGALIALKEAPRNAWIEAQVGIGGPILGTLGAVLCYGIYLITGNGLFAGLAYTGFFLNLFNLAPVGFLDGGRIATALSPWLWLVGIVIIGVFMVLQFNFLLLLIFIFSLPRVFSLFRKRTVEQQRYFEVTPGQRLFMGSLYFGLIAFLFFGMMLTNIRPPE